MMIAVRHSCKQLVRDQARRSWAVAGRRCSLRKGDLSVLMLEGTLDPAVKEIGYVPGTVSSDTKL
jgi:hypothetical protein